MSNIPPGGPFVAEEFFSPARFNRKTITHLSGSGIATLSPTYPNQAVVCTATGSGFTANTLYLRNSANTAWLGGSGGIHRHDADTDAAGGLFQEIIYANLTQIYWDSIHAPSAGQFQVENFQSAGVADEPAFGRITLSTGTQSGSHTHVSRTGIPISFNFRQKFMARLRCTAGTMITARFGVNAEHVNASVEPGSNRYGLEVCDTAGTPRRWEVFSSVSGGSTRPALEIEHDSANVEQVETMGYRVEYTPATDIRTFINTTLRQTKTSEVPAVGNNNGVRNIAAGIKNNSSSNRIMNLRGIAFVSRATTASQWT